MSNQQSSYRSIIKSTSVFGGVQVFQILLTLIKAKFTALFLGVNGMGISGILVSTLAVVYSLAGLGLSLSATREIAQASHNEDTKTLNKTFSIFSKLVFYSSIIGVIVVVLFSKQFSIYAFGNEKYTWAFIWLSITILLNVLTSRNNTLLQGTRRIKDLAKSSIFGSLVGLFTSIPLYYFFGVDGIVPALIFAAFTSFLISHFFVDKIRLVKIHLTFRETISEGSQMVKLGFIMMFASLLGAIVIFTVNSYIGREGSLKDVGLYNAGIAITSQFIGLVFSAMSMDFFPKLSAISEDNSKIRKMVNEQSEIIILMILPLLIVLILVAPLVIQILLTSEFNNLINFIRIVSFSAIFQSAVYTVSFIPLAKGDKKTYFFWNTLFNNISGLVMFIVGYKIFGLEGLGVAIILQHLVSFLVFLVVTKKMYNYTMSKNFIYFLSISILMIAAVFLVIYYFPNVFGYSFGASVFAVSICFSIFYVDKLIDIKKSMNFLTSKFRN
jgi:O-antigen/teichoic acid export membrane protein